MEVFETRAELRRRMLVETGRVGDASLAPHLVEQIDNDITTAARTAFAACAWLRNVRETRVMVGVAQRKQAFPQGASAGDIQQIGIWLPDEQRYRMLKRRYLRVSRDIDPIQDAGGSELQDVLGPPVWYDLRDAIYLDPQGDQEYELKIVHGVSDVAAESDQHTPIPVDALLVLFYALMRWWARRGENATAALQLEEYQKRLRELNSRQMSGTIIRFDDRILIGEEDLAEGDLPPRFDRYYNPPT